MPKKNTQNKPSEKSVKYCVFKCSIICCPIWTVSGDNSIPKAIKDAHRKGWRSTNIRNLSRHLCPKHAKMFKYYGPGKIIPFKDANMIKPAKRRKKSKKLVMP